MKNETLLKKTKLEITTAIIKVLGDKHKWVRYSDVKALGELKQATPEVVSASIIEFACASQRINQEIVNGK